MTRQGMHDELRGEVDSAVDDESIDNGIDVVLVTGMSGAGKSTVLRTLEDLGWEVVDNLPLLLLNRLLDTPFSGAPDDAPSRPLAIGIGTRTRGFDPASIVERIKKLR